MAIKISEREFFTELLREDLAGLSDIRETYEQEGADAAAAQLRAYLKTELCELSDRYFAQTVYDRESGWCTLTDTEDETVEKIMRNYLTRCGQYHQFGDVVDWEHNPTYNGYREWTWQLNRHFELRYLAYYYRKTGEEKYIRKAMDFFHSFAEQTACPPAGTSGFATKSWRTIDTGIRLFQSYAYLFMTVIDAPAVTDRELVVLLRSMYEGAKRLYNDNTGFNWLIMEMNGLLHTAILCPFFREAQEWRAYALRRFGEQLDLQFYPDHFQYELTTGYHGCVLYNYCVVIRMLRGLGESVPEEFARKVRDGYLMYIQLMQPDGKTPALNDGGRTSVKEELLAILEFFPEDEDFLYFRTDGKEGNPPAYKSLAMPYSGYAVFRSGWGTDDSFAMLECAPWGQAHRHDDKLEVLLWAFGKGLLVDYGNYNYDTSDMRKYIISSYSHNVALVDGLWQNHSASYDWHDEDIRKLADLKFYDGQTFGIAQSWFDKGYGDDLIPVRHERTLLWFKNGVEGFASPFYVVLDRFGANEEHTYEMLWHSPDDYTVNSSEGSAVTEYGDGVSLHLLTTGQVRVVKGQTQPYMCGWKPVHAGSAEHEHQPVPTTIVTARGASTACATLLYPHKAGVSADAPFGVSYERDVLTLRFAEREIALELASYFDVLQSYE